MSALYGRLYYNIVLTISTYSLDFKIYRFQIFIMKQLTYVRGIIDKCMGANLRASSLGPLLLTWINLNPTMDK